MSATCSACVDQLPDAIAHAKRFPGGPDSILGVVIGRDGHSAEIISAFDGIARLVQGAQAISVMNAFKVNAFPSYFVLNTGLVQHATHVARTIGTMAASAS